MVSAPLPLLILCGSTLLGLVLCQAALAFLRLFLPTVPTAVAGTVARTISSCLGRGRDPASALAGAAPRLRWPYSWRAAAAARDLVADPAAGIVATLGRRRLLPSQLVASGQAAERLGRPALLRWAESLAVRPGWTEAVFRPLVLYGGVAVLLVAMGVFITVFILPKMEQIAKDLGVVLDGRIAWLGRLPDRDGLLLIGIPLILALFTALAAWRWRRLRRMQAAEVVLAGVASGASEGEIAAAFTSGGASSAGDAGDFPAVAAAAGWPGATDPTDLATRLAEAEERGRRQRTWFGLGLQIVVPIVLAIPVWLMVSGLFAWLISILNAFNDPGVQP